MYKTFWLILTAACLVWYTVVTVYVAIKGAGDIKEMLRNLAENNREEGIDTDG